LWLLPLLLLGSLLQAHSCLLVQAMLLLLLLLLLCVTLLTLR
jgi:hypothetical protein